jgi:hypothetical protein
MLRDLVTSRNSPFFQHFRILDLEVFSEKNAIDMLVRFAPPGRRIPRALASRIVQVVGGHPFYLQLIGEALVASEPPFDEASVKAVLQSVLFSATGRLALHFQNEYFRLVGKASTSASTLTVVAERGPVRLTEVAKNIHASTASTARYLERLGDVIHRDDAGAYSVRDPLFSMWLRWRSPGGTVVPMQVIGSEAELRAAEHLALLGFDLVYQSRGSRGAFDLLALRGSEQLGLQIKRADLPLQLSKREFHRMRADASRFGWHWVIAVVSAKGQVSVLDPGKAKQARGVRFEEKAVIDNLLEWIEKRPR